MATQKIVVYTICRQCGGTGQQMVGAPGALYPIPCTWPGCVDPAQGSPGEYSIGHIYIAPSLSELQDRHDNLLEQLSDILDKVNDIKEKVDEIKDSL